jgi:hypothetical protein
MNLIQRINELATLIAQHIKTRSVPAGGTTGQVLTKTSNADYADAWVTPTQGNTEEIESLIWYYQ